MIEGRGREFGSVLSTTGKFLENQVSQGIWGRLEFSDRFNIRKEAQSLVLSQMESILCKNGRRGSCFNLLSPLAACLMTSASVGWHARLFAVAASSLTIPREGGNFRNLGRGR